MSNVCLLVFLGRKKKGNKNKPNWPNCDPVQLCKYSVKTCSIIGAKFCCQACSQMSLPHRSQQGKPPLPSPWVWGPKQKLLLECPSRRALPSVLHSSELPAGCSGLGTSQQSWGGCRGCPVLPLTPAQRGIITGIAVCFNHCCTTAQTFWPGCSCSLYQF